MTVRPVLVEGIEGRSKLASTPTAGRYSSAVSGEAHETGLEILRESVKKIRETTSHVDIVDNTRPESRYRLVHEFQRIGDVGLARS